MRTTITIDEKILKKSREKALKEGVSLAAFVEDALRRKIFKRSVPRKPGKVKIVTFKGKGLSPGIDIDDTSSLLDAMEGPGAPLRR